MEKQKDPYTCINMNQCTVRVSGPEYYLSFLLAVIHLPITANEQGKHLLREAAEAKITLDKVPSSIAACYSNWFCVVITKLEENIF